MIHEIFDGDEQTLVVSCALEEKKRLEDAMQYEEGSDNAKLLSFYEDNTKGYFMSDRPLPLFDVLVNRRSDIYVSQPTELLDIPCAFGVSIIEELIERGNVHSYDTPFEEFTKLTDEIAKVKSIKILLEPADIVVSDYQVADLLNRLVESYYFKLEHDEKKMRVAAESVLAYDPTDKGRYKRYGYSRQILADPSRLPQAVIHEIPEVDIGSDETVMFINLGRGSSIIEKFTKTISRLTNLLTHGGSVVFLDNDCTKSHTLQPLFCASVKLDSKDEMASTSAEGNVIRVKLAQFLLDNLQKSIGIDDKKGFVSNIQNLRDKADTITKITFVVRSNEGKPIFITLRDEECTKLLNRVITSYERVCKHSIESALQIKEKNNRLAKAKAEATNISITPPAKIFRIDLKSSSDGFDASREAALDLIRFAEAPVAEDSVRRKTPNQNVSQEILNSSAFFQTAEKTAVGFIAKESTDTTLHQRP